MSITRITQSLLVTAKNFVKFRHFFAKYATNKQLTHDERFHINPFSFGKSLEVGVYHLPHIIECICSTSEFDCEQLVNISREFPISTFLRIIKQRPQSTMKCFSPHLMIEWKKLTNHINAWAIKLLKSAMKLVPRASRRGKQPKAPPTTIRTNLFDKT